MKESELKKILTKPVMDQTMDQKIVDALLYHEVNIDKKSYKVGWMRTGYLFSQKALNYSISKIAIVIIVLAIVGAGTAWAAGFNVIKSYSTQIKIMTEEEIDEDQIIYPDRENAIKKVFGTGNKMIGMLSDNDGNILEIDEDGYYTFEDGSKLLAPYIPDPNRHENDRKSGNEAFAEIGYPNLIPTYLYENYLLGEKGFAYKEETLSNNVTHKYIDANFFQDYIYQDFTESIYIHFTPSESTVKDPKSIFLIQDNEPDYNYIYSSYTTKGGILCSALEISEMNSVMFHISFDSETIGNGIMTIEFINMKMDKIKEILDTIPLTEDNVDSQTIE